MQSCAGISIADLIDVSSDELPLDRRLKLSIKWRSIETPWNFPGEAYAKLQIGFFLGDAPLFGDAIYGEPTLRASGELLPGYFRGEDDNCDFLTGLRVFLETGEPIDFEDSREPVFRLIIARDAFDSNWKATPEDDYFDVLAIMYVGGAWHGHALGETGPAVKFAATRKTLRRFLLDLLTEADDPAICEPEAARSSEGGLPASIRYEACWQACF